MIFLPFALRYAVRARALPRRILPFLLFLSSQDLKTSVPNKRLEGALTLSLSLSPEPIFAYRSTSSDH